MKRYDIVSLGQPPWTRENMIDSLEEFASLYAHRPIADNVGGMKAPHVFLAWFVMRFLKPRFIIESGVLRGQGSWFFEKACSIATIYCIEPSPEAIEYRPERAQYFEADFSTLSWEWLSQEDKDNTVVFFDDHQNAFKRVKFARSIGFTHLMFEDNYPVDCGDCYSLKKVWARCGFIHPKGLSLEIPPNGDDAEYLSQNLEVYCELPPIFGFTDTQHPAMENTPIDKPWDYEMYPLPQPLLRRVEADYQQVFKDEAEHYRWMCYVKLKRKP